MAIQREATGDKLNRWEVAMALPETEVYYTIEEYLALERAAAERHQYLDGFIYAMVGESEAHGELCANLSWILGTQLRGTPCRARIANTKVRSGPRPAAPRSRQGLFSYPDLLVVCGEMEFQDDFKDVLLNPTVIFEVLSESTESFDRGAKFLRYQVWNPTLSDYVLVSQTSPTIEHYARQPDDSWTYRVYQGLKARLALPSIKCRLPLAEVYERVELPPEESEALAAPKEPARARKKKSAAAKGRKR
jgi:Uma2 family endonuclease